MVVDALCGTFQKFPVVSAHRVFGMLFCRLCLGTDALAVGHQIVNAQLQVADFERLGDVAVGA